MKNLIAIFVITLIFSSTMANGSQNTTPTNVTSGMVGWLKFSIKSVKKQYKVGEKLNFTVEFENASKKDLYFYTNLILGYNLLFEIVEPKTKGKNVSLHLHMLIREAVSKRSDFIMLKKGEVFKKEFLIELLEQLKPGYYKISSTYHNDRYYYAEGETKVELENVWREQIGSNTISIKIVPNGNI